MYEIQAFSLTYIDCVLTVPRDSHTWQN